MGYTYIAQFLLKDIYNLRVGFYLVGEIVSGEISIGNRIDLTILDIAAQPAITAIDFAHNANRQSFTCLKIDDIDDSIKERLITLGSFATPLDIIIEATP